VSAAKGKTSTGLEPNIAGLLCYVLGWVTGIIFLLLEQRNRFVRFHAIQSIATFGVLTAASIALNILAIIPFLGVIFDIINLLIGILGFILWIVLMVKAYQGKMFKLPWAGDLAKKHVRG
jgi:uncharacterized membrane protein